MTRIIKITIYKNYFSYLNKNLYSICYQISQKIMKYKHNMRVLIDDSPIQTFVLLLLILSSLLKKLYIRIDFSLFSNMRVLIDDSPIQTFALLIISSY